MSRVFGLLLSLLVGATLLAGEDPEAAAIIAVVDSAYVHGVHIDADPELMRAGMHESFVMFAQSDNGVTQTTREAWIERLTAARARAAADAPKPRIKADITVLDRAGNTAVARVALFRDEKQVFTDYISLYRFADGWKLVGKVFTRH